MLMLIRRLGPAVLVHAPAKVNLFLEVLRRRPDGYHDLATLMTAVSLCDTLECTEDRQGAVTLTCDRPGLSIGPDNLVCRAAQQLRRHTGHTGGARIRLWKRIPLEAGLAGGSSDAAATLAGLNLLWRLGLGRSELAEIGAQIGSDVAFFFSTPAAWCTGRGEVVEPLRLGRPLDLVIAKPNAGLSTARVFGQLTVAAEPRDGAEVRRALEEGRIDDLGRLLHNRLQDAAEALCPAVAEWRQRLASLGPAGTLMSGSGSAVFALCRGPTEALRMARALKAGREAGGGPVWVVRSCV
jgi:4-diphosphocytidyl-2-C-methyl-D-erythritol kinase